MKNNILSKKIEIKNIKTVKQDNNIINYIPLDMANFIQTGVDNLGLNKSIILASTLCGIAGIIGKRVSITSPNGYKIYPSLYSMNVAPSGSNKSSSIDYALEKIEGLHSDRIESYNKMYSRYQDKMKEYLAAPKSQNLSIPIKPMANYYLMGNYTWQALSSGLNYKNRHGLLIRNDEIESLLDRITNGKNQDEKSLLLSAATNGSFSKETKNEEIPENITKLCLSILGSIQDEVADKYYNKNDGSGVLARFQLFTHSQSEFLKMKIVSNENFDKLNIYKKNHHDRLDKLSRIADVYKPTFGGLESKKEFNLIFSNKASLLILDFYNNFIKKQLEETSKLLVQEYIRKMIYTVQSLALCFHCYEFGISTNIVSEDTTVAAINCTKYFYSNFINFIYQKIVGTDIKAELEMLKRYCTYMRLDDDGYFTLAVYFDNRKKVRGTSNVRTKSDAENILNLLEDNNHIESTFKKNKYLYRIKN